TAADPRDRRGVDDAAAAALGLHAIRRVLDAEEHPADQHREREVPLLPGRLADGAEGATDPGVVEDAVEPLKALDRQLDEARHVALHRDVATPWRQSIGVPLRPGERDGLGEARLVEVADHHPSIL